jgi:hypothetical protein
MFLENGKDFFISCWAGFPCQLGLADWVAKRALGRPGFGQRPAMQPAPAHTPLVACFSEKQGSAGSRRFGPGRRAVAVQRGGKAVPALCQPLRRPLLPDLHHLPGACTGGPLRRRRTSLPSRSGRWHASAGGERVVGAAPIVHFLY